MEDFLKKNKRTKTGKNSRTFNKYNICRFYIRENLKPVWIEFLRLIEEDEYLISKKHNDKSGIVSISILYLIYNYVQEKNPNFDLKKEQVEKNENY